MSKTVTAEDLEYRDANTNPTQHIRKYKETPRDRFLTQDEMVILERTLSDAEDKHLVSSSVIHALRVLLMTGARLQEVLTMKWEYVDFENGKIHLPDSKSGKKTIWLSYRGMAETLYGKDRVEQEWDNNGCSLKSKIVRACARGNEFSQHGYLNLLRK